MTDLCFIREELLERLLDDDIWSVAEIPLDYPGLQARQRHVCEVTSTGKIHDALEEMAES